MPRASLPEGCSDLIDAYEMRDASQREHERFILHIAARFHDSFIARLDPEVLAARDEELLKQRISDFLHPILLACPELERLIGTSSDLVETLFQVVMANAEDGKT